MLYFWRDVPVSKPNCHFYASICHEAFSEESTKRYSVNINRVALREMSRSLVLSWHPDVTIPCRLKSTIYRYIFDFSQSLRIYTISQSKLKIKIFLYKPQKNSLQLKTYFLKYEYLVRNTIVSKNNVTPKIINSY